MESRDWLLGGRNEILVILSVAINDFIELLVELFQLRRLRHVILQHELRCLQWRVSFRIKELQTVIDQGLIQEDSPFPQEIPSVSNNLNSSFRVVAI